MMLRRHEAKSHYERVVAGVVRDWIDHGDKTPTEVDHGPDRDLDNSAGGGDVTRAYMSFTRATSSVGLTD